LLEAIRETVRDVDRFNLLRAGGRTFFIQLLAAGCGLAISLSIAREFGPSGAGLYALVIMLTSVLGGTAALGLDLGAVKIFARNEHDDLGPCGSAVRRAFALSLSVAVVLAAGVWVNGEWIGLTVFGSPTLAGIMPVVALGVGLRGLTHFFAALARAWQWVVWHRVLTQLLYRVVVLSALVLGIPAAATGVIEWFVAAFGLSALLGGILVWRFLVAPPGGIGEDCRIGGLLALSLPLLGVSMANHASDWLSVFLVGAATDQETVGIFRVCLQLVWVPGMMLTALNAIFAPKAAALHRAGRLSELAEMARAATGILMIGTAPLFAVFLAVPTFPLSFFGEAFETGATAFRILALGQILNLATGPVGMLLAMMGRERILLATGVFEVAMLGVLGMLLIPALDLEGAAIATSSTLAVRNIVTWGLAIRFLGINATTGRYKIRSSS